MLRIRTALLAFPFLFFIVPILAGAGSSVQALPAAVVDAAAISSTAAAPACSSPYTVVSGDTLSGIAQKCNVDYATLLAANGQFTNPDLIFPGDTVAIPAGGSIPNTGGNTYTVVAGDHLFRIALRFNTTVQAILNANPWITDPNLIHPGDVITLPTGSTGIPNTGGNTYTVVAGDTLSGIAQRFSTTTAAIMSANTWISNPDLIFPGWVIVIP